MKGGVIEDAGKCRWILVKAVRTAQLAIGEQSALPYHDGTADSNGRQNGRGEGADCGGSTETNEGTASGGTGETASDNRAGEEVTVPNLGNTSDSSFTERSREDQSDDDRGRARVESNTNGLYGTIDERTVFDPEDRARRKSAQRFSACGIRHSLSRYATGRGARFESLILETLYQKETPPLGGVSFWQGMRDSNPRKRSQSPVCYRYTNPLYRCRAVTIIAFGTDLSSIIFGARFCGASSGSRL